MRRARLTYEGAILHCMNRGYDGQAVFQEEVDKQMFVELISKAQVLSRVSVLATCVMDNHYHLIVQDGSGRMADFFKQLNGEYGSYYRQSHGGRGYVFQDRYKSYLIQDESYLMLCLAYVLNNPVKAGICRGFENYRWSSAQSYFSDEPPEWLDTTFIEELFGDADALKRFVNAQADLDELPLVNTPMGRMIGGEEFVPTALERSDRRQDRPSLKRKRVRDSEFEPVAKVVQEFERMHNIKLNELDTGSYEGKRLRVELLVNLKDRTGLKYHELAELDPFADLSVNSLGVMYHRACRKG